MAGDYGRAEQNYSQALAIIEKVLGREHPDWARTSKELGPVSGEDERERRSGAAVAAVAMKGLELAEKYYEEYGHQLVAECCDAAKDRIAAGLVGEGSECYGFDDELSQDHDWGPVSVCG
jgi:hypothetical protein